MISLIFHNPVILVFGTTQEGIKTAQNVTNGEGNPYVKDEPTIVQYSMIMGTDEIIKAWPIKKKA